MVPVLVSLVFVVLVPVVLLDFVQVLLSLNFVLVFFCSSCCFCPWSCFYVFISCSCFFLALIIFLL